MPAPTQSPVATVNHIALMTGDLDRLVDFYQTVFGGVVGGRSEGTPRKASVQLGPTLSLHLFEVGEDRARSPGDDAFDRGSINHFALEGCGPEAFLEVRSRLIAAGRAGNEVHEAPTLYTLFATDPDGLFLEWILRKPEGWEPPFATTPFVGLGQPASP